MATAVETLASPIQHARPTDRSYKDVKLFERMYPSTDAIPEVMPRCRNGVPTRMNVHTHVLVNVKTELAPVNRTCIQGLYDRSITIHPLQERERERVIMSG